MSCTKLFLGPIYQNAKGTILTRQRLLMLTDTDKQRIMYLRYISSSKPNVFSCWLTSDPRIWKPETIVQSYYVKSEQSGHDLVRDLYTHRFCFKCGNPENCKQGTNNESDDE